MQNFGVGKVGLAVWVKARSRSNMQLRDTARGLMVILSSSVTHGPGMVWFKDLFEFKGVAWDGKECV